MGNRAAKAMIAAALCAVSVGASAANAPANMHKFNVTCPAVKLLPALDRAYHECNNGYVDANGSCPKFLSVFEQLLPTYDCQRPFDHSLKQDYIVSAIWLAGDAAMEDYVRLLWRMAYKKEKMFRDQSYRESVDKARLIFGSEKFRQALDGGIAEEYTSRSEAMSRELRH